MRPQPLLLQPNSQRKGLKMPFVLLYLEIGTKVRKRRLGTKQVLFIFHLDMRLMRIMIQTSPRDLVIWMMKTKICHFLQS